MHSLTRQETFEESKSPPHARRTVPDEGFQTALQVILLLGVSVSEPRV